MAFRMELLVLMLSVAATAMVAHCGEYEIGMVAGLEADGHGLVADGVMMEEEMMMDSESGRRQLTNTQGYISYAAMARNNIPCNGRGASYYNCYGHNRMNPYTRGCTKASKCARATR